MALAGRAAGETAPDLWLLVLFAIGSLVMRSAGCAYNDIVDKNYDARVARTKSRPIPSGQVSVREAQIFMVALCFVGLAVLVQFNLFAIGLGMASLAIVAVYPFMKRITHWPQLVLGLAFSWGALMGWAAVHGALAWPPVLLYAGTVMWTVGYDTIYAHQDKEDDALLGLKSTALRFGPTTKRWLMLFYTTAWLALTAAGLLAGAGFVFLGGMAAAAALLGWQIVTLDIDDAANCLARFRSNRDVGAIVFAALVLDMAMRIFA